MMLHPAVKDRCVSTIEAPSRPRLVNIVPGATHVPRKTWSEEKMDIAIKSVLGGTSVRRAALDYGIPKSTLYDRLSGKVQTGAKSGAPTYLTKYEERKLEEFIILCANMGFGKTRSDIIQIVERLLYSRTGNHQRVTNGWWESFCRRHPNIRLRSPACLSKARAIATDPQVLDQYFDILESILINRDLSDKPYQIYNVDETGMALDPKPQKIVAERGAKNPSVVTSGRKDQITVVGCVNAGGIYHPPMVIFNTKNLKPEQLQGEVAGTFYGLSAKGWMDQDLFYLWFTKHFLRYAVRARPLILLLDGHSSHYSPKTIELAREHNVILFTFPPNTTHLTQPLDKGIFGPLKIQWRNECHRYMQENPYKMINKFSFNSIFSKAWMKSITTTNIINSFKTVGVYPFDRDAITLPITHHTSSNEKEFTGFYSNSAVLERSPDASLSYQSISRTPRSFQPSSPYPTLYPQTPLQTPGYHFHSPSPLQSPTHRSHSPQLVSPPLPSSPLYSSPHDSLTPSLENLFEESVKFSEEEEDDIKGDGKTNLILKQMKDIIYGWR